MNKAELGKLGEKKAKAFLESNGYKILASNWRNKNAEIDIIAEIPKIIVFVEVKTRSYDFYGSPESSMSVAQQKRVADAASAYMIKNDYEGEIRFDIISILAQEGRFLVEHFPDAFWFEY